MDAADALHGHKIRDPYRWLENPADPRTRDWLAQQGELVAAARSRWNTADHWQQRLTELMAAGAISPPVWRGQRSFFMRRTAQQEHAVLLTTDPDGTERVLLDPMAMDPTGLTTLDSWQPSKEGDLLAYQVSEGGTEESVLRVMRVSDGAIVDGPIDRARYSPVAWLPGGQQFYFVRRLDPAGLPADEQQYHRRVYLHTIGEAPANDVEIFGHGLPMTNYYGVSVSRDGKWLQVSASEGTAPRNDLWVADLSKGAPTSPVLTPVQVGVDAQTGIEFGRDGRLYIFTDRDAPRGRLCVTDADHLEADHWRDLIAQDDTAVLDGFAILDGSELAEPVLLASWTQYAVGSVSTHRLTDGERIGEVPLPGVGTVGALIERPEGGHEAWFVYTDFLSPACVQRFDALSGATSTWAHAPGTVEVPSVHAQQEVYTSKDGTKVRLFVIAPQQQPDRPRPTILYGYGGFGVPMAPGYSAAILAWVEAGGVYAVACLRGGSEEGEQWHRDGMLGTKQNVFDDFHAAAEHLIDRGWTSAAQLGISGGSNGGLLVGAALTQRPELYRSVVCSAPLLDMVRYEGSGLGATWSTEYGSASVASELEWLLAYSPYHHVHDGVEYPATLFTVFDQDTRVDPMHARKMCAALQHSTTGAIDARPILLRSEGDVGHGARAVSRSVALTVDTLAFSAHELGLQI
ncbi:MAG TPA: S9 family peptidase [Actinobacteria bacterium]|nr:S9 family peptidase [Actinomycetota bacterium]